MWWTAALLALVAVTQAHIVMKTPIPALSPNNSPLDAGGADFPCKLPGGAGSIPDTNANVMTIGAVNMLSFTGSAVHGGGSCQISLARGNYVDKNTRWMVIHSIEGGCPATAVGNLPTDPNGSGAAQFKFVVPDHPDLSPGIYTLAWTWNNKLGNREMYMNCAYVDLRASVKKRHTPATNTLSSRDTTALPNMFVANIGNGCTVPEGTDVQYPDPGSSLETMSGVDASLGPPIGQCAVVGGQSATTLSQRASASTVVTPGLASGVSASSTRTQSDGVTSVRSVSTDVARAQNVDAVSTATPSTATSTIRSPAASTSALAGCAHRRRARSYSLPSSHERRS